MQTRYFGVVHRLFISLSSMSSMHHSAKALNLSDSTIDHFLFDPSLYCIFWRYSYTNYFVGQSATATMCARISCLAGEMCVTGQVDLLLGILQHCACRSCPAQLGESTMHTPSLQLAAPSPVANLTSQNSLCIGHDAHGGRDQAGLHVQSSQKPITMLEPTTARPPSPSSLTSNDIQDIVSLLPADSQILAVASARVYHSPFKARGEDWTHSGHQGTLVFGAAVHFDGKSSVKGGTSFEQNYWFRLVDHASGKGVVWQYQIPEGFVYQLDKPFFHFFSGKTRMFGFRFEDDGEAGRFYRRVTSRIRRAVPHPQSKSWPSAPKKQISPTMISPPTVGTFIHVAHVGLNDQGHIEASDHVAPQWKVMLQELQGHGVAQKMVRKDIAFVDGFWSGVHAAGDPQPSPARSRASRVSSVFHDARDGEAKKTVDDETNFINGFWKGVDAVRSRSSTAHPA